ncbi:MAG: hypothetical protein P8R54_31645 [Myxococcota bacterium]|nr:hypothetical protein [Myxococcota bacterium]
MLLLFLLACTPPADDSGLYTATCDGSAPSVVGVMTAMRFVRAEGNISAGYNLDGEVTDEGDSWGCGIGDYTDAEGNAGIDNAFARLIPAMEATEAVAVEGLIQDAIDSGELLLMFELHDLDDRADDGCVGITLQEGAGDPLLGTDGAILPDQTFSRDTASFSASVSDVALSGGRMDAGPMDVLLPATVLGVDVLFDIREARVRIEPQEDGTFTGFLSGGTPIDYIIQIAQKENVDETLAALLESLLTTTADLGEQCEDISLTIEFEAVPAYFVD